MIVSVTVHAEPRSVTDACVYRVNYWERASPTEADSAWLLEAQVVTNAASVQEVLEWAIDEARGRIVEVFLELDPQPMTDFDVPRTSNLVRLFGANPTEPGRTAGSGAARGAPASP